MAFDSILISSGDTRYGKVTRDTSSFQKRKNSSSSVRSKPYFILYKLNIIFNISVISRIIMNADPVQLNSAIEAQILQMQIMADQYTKLQKSCEL